MYVKIKIIKLILFYSITIIILSTSLKEAVAIFLVIKEISYHDKFRKWFKGHYLITTLFMLTSAVDIYSLMVLSSKIGGYPSLSAPFSKSMHRWIFWVGLFALIKKEIPQFIIMVCTTNYNNNLLLDL